MTNGMYLAWKNTKDYENAGKKEQRLPKKQYFR